MVPHLVTALQGPLLDLEKKILDAMPAIERWFRLEWQDHAPPFYGSVDLRNAGFKLAPVDMNLFPSGFHHLSPEILPLAVQATMAAIEKVCPNAKSVLLIPERQLHDPAYLENLACLCGILRQAGLEVRLGTLDETVSQAVALPLADGQTLLLEPLERTPRRLGLKDFDPCAVLLNNDLSAGIPVVLENLQEQYLLLPVHAGWTMRRKSTHFAAYDEVVKRFAKLCEIDSWLLNLYCARCANVDMHSSAGEQKLAETVDVVLKKIARKYREYGIQDKPYVVIKADAGTRGMGVTVRSAAEVAALTASERDQLLQLKEGLTVRDLIVQEGVYTVERIDEAVAEMVVYMINRYVIGGFYRAHPQLGPDQIFNAPGMQFAPLTFERAALPQVYGKSGTTPPNRFYLYGVVARLALLAAASELEKTDPHAI